MAEADKFGDSDSILGRAAAKRKKDQAALDEISGYVPQGMKDPEEEEITTDHRRGYTRDGRLS